MPKIIYTNVYEITNLHQKIMRFIDYWTHVENTLVSQKTIIKEMANKGEKSFTVVNALNGLLRLGYIRRAVTDCVGEDGLGAEKTKYVQLRRL